jgi:PAS domain S-box-containing protein
MAADRVRTARSSLARTSPDEGGADESPDRLRLNEERFKLLVESVQDYAIFMLDPGGRIISWNAGAERIKGWTEQEIVGTYFGIFYPEEDLAWGKPEWELDIVREQGRFEDEGWRVRKDGSKFWANVVITALYDDEGTLRGFAKVTRDLTERRQAQEARERFIANAAHELRTPLSVLIGIVSYLEGQGDLSKEQMTEHIHVISRQARRMHTLVDSLLDLTLLEQRHAKFSPESVDVTDAIERVIATVPPPVGTTMATDVQPSIARVDPVRLEQILTNLVGNAYRYGGPNVSVLSRDRGDHVEIEVRDDGPGLPPDLVDHIFEPFRRGPTGPSGAGLGLAIVKNLAESFGGGARYVAGEPGSRFIVDLPKG